MAQIILDIDDTIVDRVNTALADGNDPSIEKSKEVINNFIMGRVRSFESMAASQQASTTASDKVDQEVMVNVTIN